MSTPPRASIVVPTHNRATALAPLLARLGPEAVAHGAEIVVVDSASTDDTPAVIERAGSAIRGVREPATGASRARNAGIEAARAPVVACIDDDAWPADGWLSGLLAPFADAAVVCAGGRVVLAFPGAALPDWLTDEVTDYLAAYDLGPALLDLATRPHWDAPRGLNMAFRRDAFVAAGGFSPLLGPQGGRPSVGEEAELALRLRARGGTVVYAPAATVEHRIEAARLDRGWFLRKAYWTGWSEAVIDLRHHGRRHALGRLRWHYRPRLLRLTRGRLPAACARREAAGYVVALGRYLRRRPPDDPAPSATRSSEPRP